MAPVPWLAVASGLAAVSAAGLGVLVWRRRTEPGAVPFAFLVGTVVVWTAAVAASMVVADPTLHELLVGGAFGTKLVSAVFWFVFALEYTGRGTELGSRAVAALMVVPLATLPLLGTGMRHLVWTDFHLARVDGAVVAAFQPGPWSLLVLGGAIVLVGAGLGMLFELALARPGDHTTRVFAVTTAVLVPLVLSVAYLLRIGPAARVDLSALSVAFVAPLLAVVVVRLDFFQRAPATRRAGKFAAIDDFGDPVVIVDEGRRLVDMNEAATEFLGPPDGPLVVEAIEAVFGEAEDPKAVDRTTPLRTRRGRREFTPSVSTIEGRRDRTIGYTLVLHDITREKQRRQRFEVLNRILRHNLRNAMNAVLGYAGRLHEHTDGSGDEMLARIEAQTESLIELSEKARDIDRVTDPSRTPVDFSIEDTLENVADRFEPDVAVDVEVPADLSVTSDRVIVEETVGYAGQGLLSYNGTDDPRLELAAAVDSRGWLEVTVASNGDPVPPQERRVIERGKETPLEHSHDLDLWLVSWGVDTLGGDLDFRSDGGGPELVVRVPDLDGVDTP